MRSERIDDGRLEAWALLLQAHGALLGALERELEAEHGLPLTWYEVLLRLAREPEGAMRMQDLARSVLLSKSGVTRVVDRMEEAGLIERRQCSADRRGTYAAITAEGRAAFRRAMPLHLRGLQRHFGRLVSEDEARLLRDVLARIVRANGERADEACGASDRPLRAEAPERVAARSS